MSTVRLSERTPSAYPDAGIGTSVDSFYEYLLKCHVLLGDKEYLQMFRQARLLRPRAHRCRLQQVRPLRPRARRRLHLATPPPPPAPTMLRGAAVPTRLLRSRSWITPSTRASRGCWTRRRWRWWATEAPG